MGFLCAQSGYDHKLAEHSWWVEFKELIRTFGKDDIMTKLEAFEAELVSERKLAMQRVCNEIAEEDGGAG